VHLAAVDLFPGERVLWEGRPARHPLFQPADALLVPFSIMWCGFAVFWEASALTDDGPGPSLFRALWGIPFVLIGLYLVGGRFVVHAITSRRTRYVITDRRVLVIGGLSGTCTTSAYLSSLPPPVITVGPDGSGSLAFGAFPNSWGALSQRTDGGRGAANQPMPPVLWHIPEVRRVRDLVANSQAEKNDPSVD
jgi:hypothetical protein